MTNTAAIDQGIDIHPVITKKAYSAVSGILSAVAFILVILICYAELCVAMVPTSSMEPTLNVGDRFMYHYATGETLDYDDIVVFFPFAEMERPAANGLEALYSIKVKKETVFVKRVIGLPGDVLEMKDGYVYRNGEKLDPDYVVEPMQTDGKTYVVPDGHIFCMGDNRNNSIDSRYFGAFPMNNFFGKLSIHF